MSSGGNPVGGASGGQGNGAGGILSDGGSAGTGCTGALEEPRAVGASTLCVAKQVPVGTGGSSYEIDATEVTRGQYAAWLNQSPSPALPDPSDGACGWKASGDYRPAESCTSSSTYFRGTSQDRHPVSCVDWCDAYRYCLGVNKRLCGAIGGGAVPFGSADVPAESQWYATCTSNGQYAYPYGSTYSGQACNGKDYTGAGSNPHTTSPVGSISTCQAPNGPYSGVYDLSGNVAEWVDSCNGDGPDALCRRHGGSYGSEAFVDAGATVGSLECKFAPSDRARNTAFEVVGFRCCSSP